MLDKDGNPIVDPNDKGGKPDDQTTPPAHDVKEKEKDGGNDKEMIPSYRLREESEKKRIAEAKVAEYEKKEAERAEEARKAEEAENLKKGDHEKVIKTKDEEINSYKDKEKSWSDKDAKMKAISDKKLEAFESKYGKEALDKAKIIIGSEDPWVIMEKIDAVEEVMGEKKLPIGGGKDTPGDGSDNQGLKYYQDKMDKGEKLSAKEEADYFKLLEL